MSDNRLPALGSESSRYTFRSPSSNRELVVSVKLIFRRIFQDIAEQKGWDIPDITMKEITHTISIAERKIIFLPLLLQNP
jgi:DNA-binding response OmpR family regulator